MQYKRGKHEICDAEHEFVCTCVDNRTAAAIVAALNKLARIEAATQADADDLEQMRDGSKLTRSGIVSLLAFQQEDIAELKENVRSLEAQLSEARKSIACYQENLGDIVTYGTTADALDQLLSQQVEKNKLLRTAAESAKSDLEEEIADPQLYSFARERLTKRITALSAALEASK